MLGEEGALLGCKKIQMGPCSSDFAPLSLSFFLFIYLSLEICRLFKAELDVMLSKDYMEASSVVDLMNAFAKVLDFS